MKAKFRTLFFSILVLGISIAFSSSCKKDPTTTCISTTACPGKVFKTCAGVTGGYYEYNGVKFSWTGSDPTSAANSLASAMGCK